MSTPDFLRKSLIEARKILINNLTVNTTDATGGTHRIVEVTGWKNKDAFSALSLYLVALRASIIDQAGKICSELIDNSSLDNMEFLRSVEEIIKQPGDSQESFEDWKSKWRNPWIAEGVWHCCMWIAMEKVEIHTQGVIIALDPPHVSPKDHGFDVTALYVKADGTLGMSFIETKAYRDDPNGAISDAVEMLKAIEAGKHDTRLRQMTTSFRSIIEEPYRQRLAFSLWKNEKTLIPNPHYEANGSSVQWSRKRTVFSEISAPVVIMPHCIDGFDDFFDNVAKDMLKIVQEVFLNV